MSGLNVLFSTLGSATPTLSNNRRVAIAPKVAQRALKSLGGTSRNDKGALSLRDFCATTSYGAWNVDYKYLQYLYSTLEKVEKGDIKRLIITLPVRHGKCNPAGTLIHMEDGSHKKIEDIQIGDSVVRINSAYKTDTGVVSAITHNGVKPTLRLITVSGRSIECTHNHPLLTSNGWVEASELREGDKIAVSAFRPCPAETIKLPCGYASIMGYSIGDGSFGRGDIIITSIEPETVDRLYTLANNGGWRIYKDGDAYHFRSIMDVKGWQNHTPSKVFSKYMKKAKSGDKVVPPCIFTAPDEDVIDFISAYFACDGTTSPLREGVSSITSKSRELLEGVQILLSRFRIWSNITTKMVKYKEDRRPYYVLSISGDDLVRFASIMDIEGQKGRTLQKVAATIALKSRHNPQHRDVGDGWMRFLPKGKKGTDTPSAGWLRRVKKIRFNEKNKYGHSVLVLRRVNEYVKSDEIEKLCSDDIGWDRIVSIQEDGEKDTYFLSIDGDDYDSCSYLTWGNIINHNSEQGTVRFPIWFLSRDPTRRVAVASYNQTIANKFSRKARKIAKQFLDLSVERTAAEEWETVQGGTFRAVGVGGGLTGSGFDLLIADDTLKSREEAESETIREKIWDWYTDDFYTRREPGAAVVIISTRWHQDDLIGKILSSDTAHEWTVINLPAIAKENDVLGRRPGEALCPERYPIEQLEHTKNIIGEYAFASLYQQDPIPHEGGHFKPGNIGRVDKLPEGRNFAFCRGWDMAASDMKGDYTVGVLMARDDQNTFYILDVVRERMAPDVRDQMIRDTAAKDKMMYGDGVLQMAQQDPAAAGKMQAVAFRKMLAGYRVATEPISGNKMVLSGPYASQMNGSNVYFVGSTRRSWEQPYMEEMALFPAGKHDDAVDASAVSFNALMRMHLVPPPEIKSDYTSPTKKYLERHNKQMAKTKWRRDYV